NVRTMRLILSQAATTQDMIEELVGREDTIRLCQEWIPRAELNEMERSIYHQQMNYIPYQPTHAQPPPPATSAPQTVASTALAPHPNHRLPLASPTPEPSQRPPPSTGYQGHTPAHNQRSIHAPPPPPPPPPQHLMERHHPASTQLDGIPAQRHHPYQRPNAPYRRHQPHYPPADTYYEDNQQYQAHSHDYQESERSWNRPMANTHRIINVGEFLMRLTRSNGRGYRGRGRGRGAHQ
ncbi:hypothetical protein PTTG_30015, partial [Puccinia triticina 1-1 BBBD Race 1]